MNAESIIRALTIASLAGLLLSVGLRLTVHQVVASVRACRLGLIIAVNFLVVPALAVGAVRLFSISHEFSVGMILLAACPFAPVVPVFTRLARADLALAAGLTSLFPLLSVVLWVALKSVPHAAAISFHTGEILLTLFATITLPLVLGMTVKHLTPVVGRRILHPVEIISEGTGALSLAFVTITEGRLILSTGWLPLLAMALLCESSLALGWAVGGPERNARRVIAFGTSNRNIALAILIALQSFPGTPIVAAVVANGLLLIFLGLLHVAWWRFYPCEAKEVGSK
jgi:BASS family bile acid:Na+ symporter